ncbi:MAG: tetratricopeptide repeat protein [Pseudomonadota bacterium]
MSGSAASRGLSRRLLFTAVALALPLLFFAAVEGVLRLAGYGGYPPLFVPVEQAPAFLQPNENAVQRFFSQPAQAPRVSIDTTYFNAVKPDGALRIVVQGGSSAAGFPYGKWASPAGMLKHRLRRSFPERHIEVVSTAMSAVNSYTLLDFADEIIAVEPDAVVIYAGHNEFLGVLGVGSTFTSSQSPALTRIIMRLRRLRLYQLMERSLTPGGDSKPESGPLMARIAGERAIPLNSPLFDKGVEQFRSNMGALLQRYSKAGIPVFVGTLASNESGLPPFASNVGDEAVSAQWQTAFDDGTAALNDGRARDAVAALQRATALDDNAADAWFALGRAQLAAGDGSAARTAFRAARDRDELRFRAPGAFNVVLAELASTNNATLVDVQGAMAAEASDGIVGNDLLLEHVHPNVRGYFLLADAFFDAIGDSGVAGPWTDVVDDATAWAEQPVTVIDELAAGYRLDRLLADWPFQQTRRRTSLPPATSPLEQIAQAWYLKRLSWPDAMNRALVYYQQQGDTANASRVALNLAEAFHFLGNVQYIAGQLLAERGEHRLALGYLERAVELEPQPVHLMALATAYQRADRLDDARRTAGSVLARDPENAQAKQLLDSLR